MAAPPTIRRSDLAPRLELMPLIDVIFLLLTFFIYSFIMMVRAELLPMSLSPVAGGAPAEAALMHTLTLGAGGELRFDGEPVDPAGLDAKLTALAAANAGAGEAGDGSAEMAPGTLYVAMEARGSVDRGPVLVDVLQRVQAAGITDFAIVGAPPEAP
jgi:biopolymer transport protein ExbD